MARLPLALALAATVALISVTQAAAKPRPLGPGSHGSAVCALQWMLSGHKPSVYHNIVAFNPKRHVAGCPYGQKTADGVRLMKRRLGFPNRAVNGRAGLDFQRILRGKVKRPLAYLLRAQKRFPVSVPTPAPTACVNRLLSYAKAELGVQEHPLGSNSGIRVHYYQSSTGAYNAAWCLSFALKMLDQADPMNGLLHSAGVYTESDWAHQHGLLHAQPKIGSIVLFQDWRRPNGGHAGIVLKVGSSWFVSTEGNASNRVLERFHNLVDRQPLFLWTPGCVG